MRQLYLPLMLLMSGCSASSTIQDTPVEPSMSWSDYLVEGFKGLWSLILALYGGLMGVWDGIMGLFQ